MYDFVSKIEVYVKRLTLCRNTRILNVVKMMTFKFESVQFE